MKLSQFGVLALAAAATGITWVIAPNLVIRQGMLIAAFIGMLLFGLAVQAIYSRLRRPGIDAELWGNWRVPGAFWIVVGILVVVVCLLPFLITRDPLAH